MPFKPNYRQFAPPQLRTPSFLPEPVYMDADIPEAQPGLQGPPPALQAPEVQINAQAPNKPKSFSERYQELQKTQPQPIEGWRRPVSKFVERGVPGLVSELLNPSAKREKYAQDVNNLATEQKIKHQDSQDELTDLYKRGQVDEMADRKSDRAARQTDADLNRTLAVGNAGWEDYSGPPEMTTPGEQPNWQYANINGRQVRRPTEYAKTKQKKTAEQAEWLTVTPEMEQKYGQYGLKAGKKVDPARVTQLISMEEQSGRAREANELKRILAEGQQAIQRDSLEVRKSLGQLAASNRGSQADFRNTQQMSSAYKSEKPVQQLYEVKQAYEGMKGVGSGAATDDGTGDLTLLRYFAKLTDPSTGVREGEYRDMAGAGGIANTMNVFLSGKWMKGQKLDPQTRQSFIRVAEQLVKNREKSVSELQNVYSRRAQKFGVDPRDIFDDLSPQGPPALSAPGGGVEQWVRDANGKLRRAQ